MNSLESAASYKNITTLLFFCDEMQEEIVVVSSFISVQRWTPHSVNSQMLDFFSYLEKV